MRRAVPINPFQIIEITRASIESIVKRLDHFIRRPYPVQGWHAHAASATTGVGFGMTAPGNGLSRLSTMFGNAVNPGGGSV